jgi:hypothetical protein
VNVAAQLLGLVDDGRVRDGQVVQDGEQVVGGGVVGVGEVRELRDVALQLGQDGVDLAEVLARVDQVRPEVVAPAAQGVGDRARGCS